MNDLQAKAMEIVAKAAPLGPSGPRISAVRDLRIATGCGLREAVNAVDWAMTRPPLTRPPLTLTRAAKERAVAEMAKRLSAISENYVYAVSYPDSFKPDAAAWFQRSERRLQVALVRLAMARTAD